jgi:hypothetical protein
MNKFSKVLSISLLVVMNFVMFSPLVMAEDPTPAPIDPDATNLDLGTSISPVKFIFDVNLGETADGELTMYNVTNQATHLYPYARNFKSDGTSGVPVFIDEVLPFNNSLKDWITFDKEKVLIENVTKSNTNATKIKFKISIPKDAEYGGHYAAIMVSINDPKKTLVPDQGNIAFSADPGSLLLVNIKGKVSRDLVLKGFKATDPYLKQKNDQWLFEWMPVEFTTELENKGNTHAFPIGNIIVYQGENEVQKLSFNDTQSVIIRESTRTYSTVMEPGFIFMDAIKDSGNSPKRDAEGNTQSQLAFNWDKLSKQFFGPYKAKLLLVYDDEGVKKNILAEKDFWILPWKLILAIIILVAGYVFVKSKLKEEK